MRVALALAIALLAVLALAAPPAGAAASWSEPVVPADQFDAMLGSLSCPLSSFCLAVDDNGRFITWNGTSWSGARTVPDASDFSSVSCVSPTFCMATDKDYDALIYDGTKWSAPMDTGDYTRSLSCASVSFCMAVDDEGDAVSYDGTKWDSPQKVDAGHDMSAVSCASSTFCVAASGTDVYVYGSSGTWSGPTTFGSGHVIKSLSCPSSCVAVDQEGYAWKYNGGSSWTSHLIDPGHSLVSVSCRSSAECTAIDGIGQTVTYTGGAWGAPAQTIVGDPEDLSCPTASFCAAAARRGAYVLQGSTWSATGTGGPFTTAACASERFCVAADEGGGAVVFDGSGWGPRREIDPVNEVTGVSCPSSSFCAAVDDEGNAVTFDGSSWSAPQKVDLGGYLAGVSCPSASFCAAVDWGGEAATFDGSSWSAPQKVDPSYGFAAVSCASASSCVAIDYGGNALRFDGSSWSAPLKVDSIEHLNALSCPSSSFCAAVEPSKGHALTFDGSSWTAPQSIEPGADFETDSVSCPLAGFCRAGDFAGNVLTYSGGSWSAPAQALPSDRFAFAALVCPSVSVCVGAGWYRRVTAYLAPPVDATPPSISGTAVVGSGLSASHGSWSGLPSSYGVQWERCDAAGSGCAPITGATGGSYKLAAADVGHALRVAVTAKNSAGTGKPASSAATAAVRVASAPPGGGGPGGGSPKSRARVPALLRVKGQWISHRKLHISARLSRRANGARVRLVFKARHRKWRFRARVRHGRLRVARKLPRKLRRAHSGTLTYRLRRTRRVYVAKTRLRVDRHPARLKLRHAKLHHRRLKVSGRIARRAHGRVRVILETPAGRHRWHARAKVRHGHWRLKKKVPKRLRHGGVLIARYTGSAHRHVRGEQTARRLKRK